MAFTVFRQFPCSRKCDKCSQPTVIREYMYEGWFTHSQVECKLCPWEIPLQVDMYRFNQALEHMRQQRAVGAW
jgi:uncharacterized protein CbrC (UPF0167 family)